MSFKAALLDKMTVCKVQVSLVIINQLLTISFSSIVLVLQLVYG